MSTRFVKIGAIFLILFVAAGSFFLKTSKKQGEPGKNPEISQKTEAVTDNNLDTDRDGLKDWQETLLKTDANNPDTDGDGTNDGDETKNGRDPKKIPPDSASFDSISEIVANFKAISEKVVPQSTLPSQPTTPVPVKVPDNDLKPLHDYGNTLGQLIKSADLDTKSEEKVVFSRITGQNTPTSKDFDNLSALASAYDSLAAQIKAVSAPESAKTINNSLIIGYENLSDGLKTLASHKTSLAIPGSAFEEYNKQALSLGRALIDTIFFFKNNGITFTSNEPGSIFSSPI